MYGIGLDLGLVCAAPSNLPFFIDMLVKDHNLHYSSCQLCHLCHSLNPVLFSVYHTPNSRYLPQKNEALLNLFTDGSK